MRRVKEDFSCFLITIILCWIIIIVNPLNPLSSIAISGDHEISNLFLPTTHANHSFSNQKQIIFGHQKQLNKCMVYKWFESWLSYLSQNFDPKLTYCRLANKKNQVGKSPFASIHHYGLWDRKKVFRNTAPSASTWDIELRTKFFMIELTKILTAKYGGKGSPSSFSMI